MTQIEKHEKAIKILLAIQECERLIKSFKKELSNSNRRVYNNAKQRIEINTKIKSRLENYYKNFKF